MSFHVVPLSIDSWTKTHRPTEDPAVYDVTPMLYPTETPRPLALEMVAPEPDEAAHACAL